MNEYYKPYGQKAKIYGAIINIIVSLGYRVQMCGNGDAHPGFNEHKVKACVDNIQGMLDELMVRDQDTLGLQVLLGLVSEFSLNAPATRCLWLCKTLELTCGHITHSFIPNKPRPNRIFGPHECRHEACA